MPQISIIIATYNSENCLSRALNSVLNLKNIDWECIIVDGLSSDHTIDIIEDYHRRDKRFIYISEKDNGIYDALNKGVKMSNGEWIYVLGSDDELTPDGLSNLLSFHEKYDVVYGNVYIRSTDGNITKFIAKNHKKLKYVMNCSHQAVIMRKSLINELNGFNLVYKIRADFDLMQRAYLKKYNFHYVNTYVAYFLTAGLSSTAKMSTHIERYYICKANRSSSFPLLWYCYQESKYIVREIILRKILLWKD